MDSEQPWRNATWSLPYVAKFRGQLYDEKVDGRSYGRKNPETGDLLKKEWLVVSSDHAMPGSVERRCQNRGRPAEQQHPHEEIEGNTTEFSGGLPDRAAQEVGEGSHVGKELGVLATAHGPRSRRTWQGRLGLCCQKKARGEVQSYRS